MNQSCSIYFGLPPQKDTDVDKALREKGILYSKSEPAKIHVSGGPLYIQPRYALYTSHLPRFMAAAYSRLSTVSRQPFANIVGLTRSLPILPFKLPGLAITWGFTLPEEVRESLKAKGFRDAQFKGKPGMIIDVPSIQAVRDARETKCLDTSPSNKESMNIQTYKSLLVGLSVVSAFLRVHQYPAFIDDEHAASFGHDIALKEEGKGKGREGEAMETDEQDDSEHQRFEFKINLPKKPEEMTISYHDQNVPEGNGLCFPFEPELCKPDRTTFLTLINTYFYNALGEDEQDCREEYSNLVSAWNQVATSKFADEVSHFAKVVLIALKMQCTVHPMFSNGTYEGCVMNGAGYELWVGDKCYVAQESSVLNAEIRKMDAHWNALSLIYSKINFAQDADRVARMQVCRRMCTLKNDIDALGLIGGSASIESVKTNAVHLRFVDDKVAEVTAFQFSTICDFIADPTKDLNNLPSIHHSVLFSSDRVEICLSAFGTDVPSFRVPGGRQMSIDKDSFSVLERGDSGRPSERRAIKKIGAIIVPLQMGVQHFKQIGEDKLVLNPFGNKNSNTSATHISKPFDGESTNMILAALRRVHAVSVSKTSGTKRPRTDDDDARAAKRGKASDFF